MRIMKMENLPTRSPKDIKKHKRNEEFIRWGHVHVEEMILAQKNSQNWIKKNKKKIKKK